MASRKRKKTGAKKAASPARGASRTTKKGARPAARKAAKKKGAKRASGGRDAASSGKLTVGDGEIDVRSIERLVRLMSENDLLEIEVRNGPDHQIRLSRRAETAQVVYSAAPVPSPGPPPARPSGEAPAAPAAPPSDPNVVEFLSPMVGTFYRAPSPESPPYVTTGDRVADDTVVCIIEAMKVLNEIKAEVKGEVVDILVENGEAVEYGQPLFLIRKSG